MTSETTTKPSPRSSRKIAAFILVMLGLAVFLLWINTKYTLGTFSIVKEYVTTSSSPPSSPPSTADLVASVEQIRSQMEVAGSSLLSTIADLQNTTTWIRNKWPDKALIEGQVITPSAPSTSLHPWPKLVFQCGHHTDLLANLVFPNVPRQEYQGVFSIQQLANQNSNTNSATQTRQEEVPPLVVGMHGPCSYNAKKVKNMWVHVQRHFPGKAIFFNGESFGDARGHNTYQVGALNPTHADSSKYNRSLKDVYYMSWAFLEISPTPQQRDVLFDHAKKPKNTGQHGVIYLASNCQWHRQVAADRISDVDPENLIVYYRGGCHGLRADNAAAGKETPSKLLLAPSKLRNIDWIENGKVFQHYRYCLVMENRAISGYITEKIVNAFVGGCVPIYYGTTEIFDVFNKDAFIFYDVDNPELALEQIRYMEKDNRTAYDEMLAQPILANGTDTIERYFSLRDDIGGGKLIRQIRAMLGYDPNNPFL